MAWILHDVCLAMPPVDCERRLKRRLANPATGCVACYLNARYGLLVPMSGICFTRMDGNGWIFERTSGQANLWRQACGENHGRRAPGGMTGKDEIRTLLSVYNFISIDVRFRANRLPTSLLHRQRTTHSHDPNIGRKRRRHSDKCLHS